MAKRKPQLIAYHVGVTLLTMISVGTVLLLLMGVGKATIEIAIINGLLVVFAVDYVARLVLAKNRKIFLIQSAFDLLGIIPLHPVFAFFRLGRLVRLIRYHHLFWRLRLNSKWTRAYHQFIYKTGFIYLFSFSVTIIVVSAFLFSLTEKQSLANALWWAITTATTVGYGDETPHTAIGKIIASVLMIGGVGFIGLLTSTISGFFTTRGQQVAASQEKHEQADFDQLLLKIEASTTKVDDLQHQLDTTSRHKQR
ncbi:two pore domain potassium channel family protein [Levilactobacillus parabrevis]|uniref:potassium channel family protein n=1 Tax=Levilactobacillus parabrevis TaxID=357278 RepID=UPI0021A45D15|nr:potassium channel family protein [Levilactobacillus parabrevis]MCT4490195.1 two pore domain potassium channel family protein [Levilactobacillus parabrevis]